QIKIATRPAGPARFALAGDAHTGAIGYAGRNLDLKGLKATVRLLNLDRAKRAGEGLLETDRDRVIDVLAANRPVPPATRASASKQLLEEVAEIVGFDRRSEIDITRARRASKSTRPADVYASPFSRLDLLPFVAEAIVLFPFPGVCQNLVRLTQLLELGLGRLVIRVQIGMELASELA